MAIIWDDHLDDLLQEVVNSSEGLNWKDVSRQFTERTGLLVSSSSVNHRYLSEGYKYNRPEPEPVLESVPLPSVARGDFVGFNMAFYDVESSGLSAWGNELTCAAIADNFGNIVRANKFEFPQSSVLDDHGLVVWLRDELEKYDILVAWYGTMFDLPFMNAKLIEYGEKPIRDMLFLDPCFKVRGGRYGLKVGSSKLKNTAKWLNTPNQKPDVEWETFRLASIGDPDALAEVIDRCDADVLVMRDIFQRIKPMIRTIHR